jgi:hypothetical protein
MDDPGLLGLGELEIAGREHRQPIGGRIDFLMRDTEAETFYEVEVMLGACHIEFRVTGETRDSVVSSLQNEGIDASPQRTESATFGITSKELEEHSAIITDVLRGAEEASRT